MNDKEYLKTLITLVESDLGIEPMNNYPSFLAPDRDERSKQSLIEYLQSEEARTMRLWQAITNWNAHYMRGQQVIILAEVDHERHEDMEKKGYSIDNGGISVVRWWERMTFKKFRIAWDIEMDKYFND